MIKGKGYNFRLTEEDVVLILELIINEGLTQSLVAKKFEVSHTTINYLIRGKSKRWKHIRDTYGY